MDFKCVAVLSTEELMNLKKEVEKVLNARRGQEAQKIWDTIMANLNALIDMNADCTMVTDSADLLDLYHILHERPDWEFDFDIED